MTSRLLRRRVRAAICALIFALCAGATIAAGAADSRWQCAPAGTGALAPALAEAARDYLDRVEVLYPHQALGLVRAAERFYLLNSSDIDWRERARLNLLALRLRETYLTAERRATATPGAAPPPGGFVCLASARAQREGLSRTPSGDIVLAAGRSLHLVDPQEPYVAVEIVAAPDRSLGLGELFHRSARNGIYAGLTGRTARPPSRLGGAAADTGGGGTLILRIASAGGTLETRLDAVEGAGAPAPQHVGTERAPALPTALAAVTPADDPKLRQPAGSASSAPEPRPAAPPLMPGAAAREPPPAAARAVQDAATAATIPAEPALSAPPAPVRAAAHVRLPGIALPEDPSGTGQSYDEYAKTMKRLMALRRSSSVRSISEMTYVHPAVELIRRRNP